MSEKASPPMPDTGNYQSGDAGSSSQQSYQSTPPVNQQQQQQPPQQASYVHSGYAAAPLNQPGGYNAATPLVAAQPVVYGGPAAHIMLPGQVLVNPAMMFPHFPCSVQCPMCHAQVITRISKQPGTLAWLSCGGLALIGCWFGCCLIPFCIDGCLDTEHWCPNCNRLIARRNQMDC